MSRRPIVAGNWKMHKRTADAQGYCRELAAGLGPSPAPEVLIFPSYTLLPAVVAGLRGTAVEVGGQDCHPEEKGAHTGDVAAGQLADVGCRWVLCGHSERRHDHGETDEAVGEKAGAARRAGLLPLVCVGETGEERSGGRTEDVLRRQLRTALASEPSAFELAYEPVWAIGSGDTATPEMAQDAHAFLRRELRAVVGAERSAATRILYGGSVKPGNASGLIAQPDLDGFLVGGASLDAGSFLDIIGACPARA